MESLISAMEDVFGLIADIHVINHHGMTDQEIIIKILRHYGVGEKIARSGLKMCMDHMQQRYAEIVQSENIVVLEGVLNLLAELEPRGIFLGLVTGNLEPIARAKLNKIKIDHYFKFGGFGSDHISRTELVKLAARRAQGQFDLSGRRKMFHVGDAPQDMRAAREAGATPIGVTTGVFAAEDLEAAGACMVVPNLKNAALISEFMLLS